MRAPEGVDGVEAQGAVTTPDPAPAAAPTEAAPDYSWVPGDYLKDGQPDFGAFSKHYSELAADAARRAEQPQAPEAYEYKLPEDFTFGDLPEVKIAADDPDYAPIFQDLGAFAKDRGLSQSDMSGLMGMLAKYQASQIAKFDQQIKQDVATLGPTPQAVQARIERVKNTIVKTLPEKQAEALMGAVKSAAGVQALESLFAKNLGPLTSPSTPAPRDPLAARYPTMFAKG